ncbi:uncharacterized protein LOC34624040 [Cyclospora cayetanensis]|uniref:Uncharacterized protein LOC34624040 n=1 Tax=Cyclospora cayetanensis TaxID=88456 RepID=A0A6P6RVU5_9EIME|nr:uncharacterized protein LOC34624040 [Cyclospora cayetanensis]
MESRYLSASERADNLLESFANGFSFLYPKCYADLSVHKESAGKKAFGPLFSPLLAWLGDGSGGVTSQTLARLAESLRLGKLRGFHGEIDLSRNSISDIDLVPLLQALRTVHCVTGLRLRDTWIGDASAPLLASILKERSSFLSLDVSGTNLTDVGVIRLCQATRVHRSVKRLSLPKLRQRGLFAVIAVIQQCPFLDVLEFGIHENVSSLEAPGGLCEPDGPMPSAAGVVPKKLLGSRKNMHVPTQEEDDARSLKDSEEGSSGLPFTGVEVTRQAKYIEVRRSHIGVQLGVFACWYLQAFARGLSGETLWHHGERSSFSRGQPCLSPESREGINLTGGGVEDFRLRHVGLAFEQLAKERELALEKNAKSQDNTILSQDDGEGKAMAPMPPVPLRVYVSSVLEQRLTQALMRLVAAKKELPWCVDTPQKEMAFVANELYEGT